MRVATRAKAPKSFQTTYAALKAPIFHGPCQRRLEGQPRLGQTTSVRTQSRLCELCGKDFVSKLLTAKNAKFAKEDPTRAQIIRAGSDQSPLWLLPLIPSVCSRAHQSHRRHFRRVPSLSCPPAERVCVRLARRVQRCTVPSPASICRHGKTSAGCGF